MKKRCLAILLALCMALALFPTAAFAMEGNYESIHGIDLKRQDVDLNEIVFSQEPLGVAEVRYLGGDGNWHGLRTVIVPDGTTVSAPSYPKEEGEESYVGPCVTYMTGPGITWVPAIQPVGGFDWHEDDPVNGMAEYSNGTVYVDSIQIPVGSVEVPTEDAHSRLYYNYYDELNLLSESGAKYLAASGTTYISPIILMTIARFSDLSPTGYYLDAVEWAVSNGITNGTSDTTFSPDRTCSHVEIVTFLYRAAGAPDANATAPVQVESYFQDAVDWAYGEGIIDDSFHPDAECTRADTVTYMWKAKGSPAADGGKSFTDVPAGADYLGAVNWAVAQGVTTGAGDGSTFEPGTTCDRAQIVTFLYRAYA